MGEILERGGGDFERGGSIPIAHYVLIFRRNSRKFQDLFQKNLAHLAQLFYKSQT